MMYIDTDILKAEQSYRRERITRDFRAVRREPGSDKPKPVKHRARLHLRHAA
jgi:hypothetical protein